MTADEIFARFAPTPAETRKVIRCHCRVCKGVGAEVNATANTSDATRIHNLVKMAHTPLRGTMTPLPA